MTITKDLGGTALEAFWSNLSFLLTVVISQPVYTSVSDVLGRKAPFYAGFVIFFIGSIVFAIAESMPVLIAGRLLQGLGGGGLDVLSEIILVDITTLQERPLYLGLLALPMAGGGVCGPVVGAALAEYVSWRWIGWIILPCASRGFF
jgi:MFS family permease